MIFKDGNQSDKDNIHTEENDSMVQFSSLDKETFDTQPMEDKNKVTEIGQVSVLNTLGTSFESRLTDIEAKVEYVVRQLVDIATISVLDAKFNVKTDGTDTTLAFKEVLDYAVANKLRVLVPPATYTVAGLEFPSNLEIHFYIGAKLKLVPDSPAWTRCVRILSENVYVTGLLEVDGNMDSIKSGNEHMHGLFIYNARNVFIENVYSHDCYGDNVCLSGGSDNDGDYSENVNINNIKAIRAGRKNLVIEHIDNLNIQVADLDNSTGGIDGKGSNSLDVEPFNYTGTKKKFTVNLGNVKTKGCGNDFSAGTTLARAEGFVINIDNMECNVLDLPTDDTLNGGGWKTAIFSYAITLNINHLVTYLASTKTNIGSGIFTKATRAIWIQHGAIININNMKVYGGCNSEYVIRLELGDDAPSVTINNLLLACPISYGIKNERANLFVGKFKIKSLLNRAIYGDTLSNNIIKIGMLDIENSCTTSVFEMSSGTTVTTASINLENVRIVDTRQTKLTHFLRSSDKNVLNSLKLGAITLPQGVNLLAMEGALTSDSNFSIKSLNNSIMGSIVYVFKNPEGIVTADRGTIAINKSGSKGSIFYLKETDGINTGWKAL
ncbi:hypothetical protein [Peribacillus loiseleuriae]|uniref:hypothetical protein n=1 Tax=Peribacillus loiseleuriae TaxID=1679170 RepID=UPI003CFE089F